MPERRMSANPQKRARAAPVVASELRLFLVFQHCDDHQLTRLARFAREQAVESGQTLFATGDADCDFFLVLTGGVELIRETAAGPLPLARVRVGQLFGEVSFLDRQPRDRTARALEASAVLRFDGSSLRKTLEDDFELAVGLDRVLWQALAAKLREADQRLLEATGGRPDAAPATATPLGESVGLDPDAKLELFHERGLAAAELRLLVTTLPAESYPAGASLFLEGDAGHALYVVVSGEVHVVRRMTGGSEEQLAILGRGEVLGELALVDDGPRSADARAGGQGCTVLVFTRQDLDDVLNLPPVAASQFLGHICAQLCRRLRRAVEALAALRTAAE
jgi:CRP/FNR family cyclic AMP-dependent transcriptional regulator